MISSWKILDNIEQLDSIHEESGTKPTVIFKHSTRCGISLHAKHNLESDWNFNENELIFYYLDLLEHRDISNEIAKRFNVIHQSPQIIILKQGKSIFDTSHNAISLEVVQSNLS